MIDWNCANCGCTQWMPADFNTTLRNNHKTFYCVNGHGNVYNKKTDIEEIEGKLANEYAKNAQLEKLVENLTTENNELKKTFFQKLFNKNK